MTEELLEQINAWNQELILRGTGQLGLRDLEKLELFAAEASGLQMAFLEELLQQLLSEGRVMLLGNGNGDEASLHLHFARLVQYVRMGSIDEKELAPD
ncbi:hypothetical protein ACX93W_14185 [Paenibacillus sp. CAU 1782]